MLKKIIVISLVILVIQKWDTIYYYVNPLPDYSSAHDGKVILYATDWCGYCEKTRSLLRTYNIDFFEYDIEKSQEGLAQYTKLGGKGIPVLFINGRVIHGYDPEKIIALAGN